MQCAQADESRSIRLNNLQATIRGDLSDFRGSCGVATVAITGVAFGMGNQDEVFATNLSGADLVVSNGAKRISLSHLLSDRNVVVCRQTARGSFLDFASGCSGQWCEDALEHHVVLLDTLEVKPKYAGCDEFCVAGIVGLPTAPMAAAKPGTEEPEVAPVGTDCYGSGDYRVCTWTYTDANGDVHAGSYDSEGSSHQLDSKTTVLPDGEVQSSTTDSDGNSYSIRSWTDASGSHTEDSDGNVCTVTLDGDMIGCP